MYVDDLLLESMHLWTIENVLLKKDHEMLCPRKYMIVQ